MPEIRRLGESDRPAWRAMRHALWPEAELEALDAEIAGQLADRHRQPAFGIFEAETLLGFAEASEREWGEGCETAPVAWVEGIYVDPGHRRRGLGRALIEAVAAWARARGLTELGSDTEATNRISLKSHKAWGFNETVRLVMLRRKLDP